MKQMRNKNSKQSISSISSDIDVKEVINDVKEIIGDIKDIKEAKKENKNKLPYYLELINDLKRFLLNIINIKKWTGSGILSTAAGLVASFNVMTTSEISTKVDSTQNTVDTLSINTAKVTKEIDNLNAIIVRDEEGNILINP